MFAVQLLGTVMVRVDIIGAIFMASNITTTYSTKHVDIWDKYVNEYVEDGVVKIIFVKSVENDSNILTKHLSAELHKMHSKKMVVEKSWRCS